MFKILIISLQLLQIGYIYLSTFLLFCELCIICITVNFAEKTVTDVLWNIREAIGGRAFCFVVLITVFL